jgi:hypothetical protein
MLAKSIINMVVKKLIKNNMNHQIGGGEKNVFLFLPVILVIIVCEFIICDSITRIILEELKQDELTTEELKKYKNTIYATFIPLIFINMLLIFLIYKLLSNNDNNSVKNLFTVSFIIMITSIIISYIIKVAKSKNIIFFSEYIGVSGYSIKQIGIGMMTNIIFGFIDNFGLFFGMDSLDDFLNGPGKVDGLAALKTAGWGNTFSDFLGAFVGNSVGDISSTLSGVDKTPIISEIIGIVIGCIIGIYVPAALKKKLIS